MINNFHKLVWARKIHICQTKQEDSQRLKILGSSWEVENGEEEKRKSQTKKPINEMRSAHIKAIVSFCQKKKTHCEFLSKKKKPLWVVKIPTPKKGTSCTSNSGQLLPSGYNKNPACNCTFSSTIWLILGPYMHLIPWL